MILTEVFIFLMFFKVINVSWWWIVFFIVNDWAYWHLIKRAMGWGKDEE